MLTNFSYIRPNSLKEAVRALTSGAAVLHAGGTDLIGCLRDHVFDIKKMVSISGLKELEGVRKAGDGGLRIGALTTIAGVAENSFVQENYAALAQAAEAVASPQLRNQGTIGGNLCQKPRCWYYRGDFHCLRKGGDKCFAATGENQYHCIIGGGPCFIVHPSDTAAALVAHDASIRTVGPKGTKTIAVEKFHVLPSVDARRETVLGPGEIVTEIVLPPPRGARSSYRKVRDRAAWDFALAGVALAIQVNGGVVSRARVVLSGAAPVPWRSKEAEEMLIGKNVDVTVAAKAAGAALRNAQPLAQNGYKVPMFRALIEDQLVAMTSRA